MSVLYIGVRNATPKHWWKALTEHESVQPFKKLPLTCWQARAFYVSKSFQKPTSEVRFIDTGFTDYTFFHSKLRKT